MRSRDMLDNTGATPIPYEQIVCTACLLSNNVSVAEQHLRLLSTNVCCVCSHDGKVTFDIEASLARSEVLPASSPGWPKIHLKNPGIIDAVSVPIYDSPELRICPAGMSPAALTCFNEY